MKTKTIVILVAILLLILGLLITIDLYKKEHAKRLAAEAKGTTDSLLLQGMIKPTKVYKDSNGNTHIEFKAATNEIDLADKENEKDLVNIRFVDSVATALKAKPKQVESIMVIPSEIHMDSVKFLERKVDSLTNLLTFSYKDKNLTLKVRPGNPIDTTDKGEFDFAYNAELTTTQYWKRAKILGLKIGSKESFLDISSNDPRISIFGLRKYTIKQKQPEFGLRFQLLNSAYFMKPMVFTSAVGARFDFSNFSLGGYYSHNWDNNNNYPYVTVAYDFLRF